MPCACFSSTLPDKLCVAAPTAAPPPRPCAQESTRKPKARALPEFRQSQLKTALSRLENSKEGGASRRSSLRLFQLPHILDPSQSKIRIALAAPVLVRFPSPE